MQSFFSFSREDFQVDRGRWRLSKKRHQTERALTALDVSCIETCLG